ncbi:TPA: hypothetical protein WI656_000246 [Neisseria meningitidis]|uniref:hypothetical protein n=1 Tax=Neisseria meningitidis TaxID=487 RepID=UPI000C33D633|nr:hypothetical protein [Neisseria meningitidis]RNK19774.1 hypothetical protein COI20_02595 [Neisseria meningitidis]RPC77688.1 hypothetical protein JY64_04105 [Neisseria meningitidis]
MTDRPSLLWIKPGQAEIMEYCEPEEASDPYATYRCANLMAVLPLFVVILVLLNIVFPLPAYPLAWLVPAGFMVLGGGFPLSLPLVVLLVLTCCILLARCPPLSRLLCYPCPNHPMSKNSA